MPKIAKPLMKPYGFRMTSRRVWVRKDDMLYVMIPLINTKDTAVLYTSFLAKPVFADDYPWDILGMEENKSEPFSLRVTGAFTAPQVRFHVSDHPLSVLDVNANRKMSFFAGMQCHFLAVSMRWVCSLDYPLLVGLKPVKS